MIANGDKPFWSRDVSSLSYSAEIITSSNLNASYKLSDFKLFDTDDANNITSVSNFGAWIPDADDSERSINISFSEPINLRMIRIFGSPDISSNINSIEFSIDNGECFQQNGLNADGSHTDYFFNSDNIRFINIKLSDTVGSNAGISEIEIYDTIPTSSFKFIKLTNQKDDFAYDYYISRHGTEAFSLYSFNCSSNISDYSVSIDNPYCSYEIKDSSTIIVHCPRRQSCILSVSSNDCSVSDSIKITNPSSFSFLCSRIEPYFFNHIPQLKQTATYNLYRTIVDYFQL